MEKMWPPHPTAVKIKIIPHILVVVFAPPPAGLQR